MIDVELDAQGAKISRRMFEWMFRELPAKNISWIEAHPSQIQAYEEMCFAKQEITFAEGEMPGFDGVPNDGKESGFWINSVKVRCDIRYPEDKVGFVKDGELVGQIKNLELPVYQ